MDTHSFFGLNIQAMYYTLLSVLALTIVAALQTAGIILVISLLVTPGSIAYLLTDRFDRMLIISTIASVFSCVFGTYFSYHLDVSTGGSIVVLLTLLFVVAMIFAPKYGILAQEFRKRSAHTLEDDSQKQQVVVDQA